jgi:hypothetical protein
MYREKRDAATWCFDYLNQFASNQFASKGASTYASTFANSILFRARLCIACALLRNGLQNERLQRAFVMFALQHPDLCLAILILHDKDKTLFEAPLDVNRPFRDHTALHVCAFTGRSPLLIKELIRYCHVKHNSALVQRSKRYPYRSSCRLCYDWVVQAKKYLQSPLEYRFKDYILFDRPIDAIVQWWAAEKRPNTRCIYAPLTPTFTIAHELALECLVLLIRQCSDNTFPHDEKKADVSLDSGSFAWSFKTPGSDMITSTLRERLLTFCAETETKCMDKTEEQNQYMQHMYMVTQKIRQELQDVRNKAIKEREEYCDIIVDKTRAVHGIRSLGLLVVGFVFPLLK